jgi:hypothetical protein
MLLYGKDDQGRKWKLTDRQFIGLVLVFRGMNPVVESMWLEVQHGIS